MSPYKRQSLGVWLFAFASCASNLPTENRPPDPAHLSPESAIATDGPPPTNSSKVEHPPTCGLFQKEGVLNRAALNRIIDEGLGRWLGEVEGDRVIAKGRFQGWIVKRLHPNDVCYQRVPVKEGDLVLRINGKSIEKPEQAFEVFESLRKENELRIDYSRRGKVEMVRFSISETNP